MEKLKVTKENIDNLHLILSNKILKLSEEEYNSLLIKYNDKRNLRCNLKEELKDSKILLDGVFASFMNSRDKHLNHIVYWFEEFYFLIEDFNLIFDYLKEHDLEDFRSTICDEIYNLEDYKHFCLLGEYPKLLNIVDKEVLNDMEETEWGYMIYKEHTLINLYIEKIGSPQFYSLFSAILREYKIAKKEIDIEFLENVYLLSTVNNIIKDDDVISILKHNSNFNKELKIVFSIDFDLAEITEITAYKTSNNKLFFSSNEAKRECDNINEQLYNEQLIKESLSKEKQIIINEYLSLINK